MEIIIKIAIDIDGNEVKDVKVETEKEDQMNYVNEMLKSKGHLFLNEVYDLLGIPRTKAGQIDGNILDYI